MPVSDHCIDGIVLQFAHFIGQFVGHAGGVHERLQHLAVVLHKFANGFGLQFTNARVLGNVIAGDGELGFTAQELMDSIMFSRLALPVRLPEACTSPCNFSAWRLSISQRRWISARTASSDFMKRPFS